MATLPSTFSWARVNLTSDDPTQTNNPGEYVYFGNKKPNKQRFGFDLTLQNNPFAGAMEFFSFIVSQAGSVWLLPNPLPQIGSGQTSTTCRATFAVGKFGTSIQVNGPTANQAGFLMPGDFIRPVNNKKVYMVTNQVNTDGTGSATINIYPPLNNAASGTEEIEFGNNVEFQVRLENDESDILIAASRGNFAEPKIDVVEAK